MGDGCKVGKIRRAYSAKVRKGHIVSQKPKPGKSLPRGAKVSVVVSKGHHP